MTWNKRLQNILRRIAFILILFICGVMIGRFAIQIWQRDVPQHKHEDVFVPLFLFGPGNAYDDVLDRSLREVMAWSQNADFPVAVRIASQNFPSVRHVPTILSGLDLDDVDLLVVHNLTLADMLSRYSSQFADIPLISLSYVVDVPQARSFLLPAAPWGQKLGYILSENIADTEDSTENILSMAGRNIHVLMPEESIFTRQFVCGLQAGLPAENFTLAQRVLSDFSQISSLSAVTDSENPSEFAKEHIEQLIAEQVLEISEHDVVVFIPQTDPAWLTPADPIRVFVAAFAEETGSSAIYISEIFTTGFSWPDFLISVLQEIFLQVKDEEAWESGLEMIEMNNPAFLWQGAQDDFTLYTSPTLTPQQDLFLQECIYHALTQQ